MSEEGMSENWSSNMDVLNCKEKPTKKLGRTKEPGNQKKPVDRIERARFCGRERMRRFRERKRNEGTYAEYLEKQRQYRQRVLERKKYGLEPEVRKKENLKRKEEIYRKKKESHNPYLDSPNELLKDIARVKKVLPKNREKAVILLKLLINDYEREINEEKLQKCNNENQIEMLSCQSSSLEGEVMIKEEIVIKEEIIDDCSY